MKRNLGIRWAACLRAILAISAMNGLVVVLPAAPPERPNLNPPADPRPNILPDWIYSHHVPSRAGYNRPSNPVGQALYWVLSPTSQEALSWKENLAAGRYHGHHCPPVYNTYYYPKPWEVLTTGPRPANH